MAEYRLSERARQQLAEIYARTELDYGPMQADAYNAGLKSYSNL